MPQPEPFYWRHARDSLITPRAVQLFQLVAQHEGQPFDSAKDGIDQEYAVITGHESERHGGKIQTAINVYREAGWVDLTPDASGQQIIKLTPAGRQALQLLGKLPDFLKAVPYFVIEMLSRYQLNNPARPDSRDPEYDSQLRESNVFPYWTLFYVMRSCDNSITSEELKRFVFQIKRKEDVPGVIQQIKSFRKDVESGTSQEELDRKYPAPLEGAVAEPKYLMGRLGTQLGEKPPVVEKEGVDRWILNSSYLSFIDEVLANEPIFQDHLDEKTWMQEFGRAVDILEPEEDGDAGSVEDLSLADTDPVWLQVNSLVARGSLLIILTGPPGTSKTWYARRIAQKIAGSHERVKLIQFHPSFSYDDFVEGYVPVSPTSANSNRALFEIVPKIFVRLCNRAKSEMPPEKHVLVIDEINRGDISRIFGELLTYLEPDYRGKPFLLAYSGRRTVIPPNVIIVGTMNPYDKSITELDDALERRFDRISLGPDETILRSLLISSKVEAALVEKIVKFFKQANKDTPHGFGHAFFKSVQTEQDLIELWNHKLKFVFEKIFRFDEDKYKEMRAAFAAILTDASALA
jgi:5-methylcytosine-specific restriction enzyme B